jgi:hypothetical protein
VKAFPLTRSEDFGNQPKLLNSLPQADNWQHQAPLQDGSQWLPGDRFLLVTDALAQWFLNRYEGGHQPWQFLECLVAPPATDEAFVSWIDQLRDESGLRNDDVTLVVIDL